MAIIYYAGFERAALTLKKMQVLDMSGNRFNNSILSFVNVLISLKTLILQGIGMDGLFPIKGIFLGSIILFNNLIVQLYRD